MHYKVVNNIKRGLGRTIRSQTGKGGFDVTNYADINFSDRHDFIDYFIVSFQQISMKIFSLDMKRVVIIIIIFHKMFSKT